MAFIFEYICTNWKVGIEWHVQLTILRVNSSISNGLLKLKFPEIGYWDQERRNTLRARVRVHHNFSFNDLFHVVLLSQLEQSNQIKYLWSLLCLFFAMMLRSASQHGGREFIRSDHFFHCKSKSLFDIEIGIFIVRWNRVWARRDTMRAERSAKTICVLNAVCHHNSYQFHYLLYAFGTISTNERQNRIVHNSFADR